MPEDRKPKAIALPTNLPVFRPIFNDRTLRATCAFSHATELSARPVLARPIGPDVVPASAACLFTLSVVPIGETRWFVRFAAPSPPHVELPCQNTQLTHIFFAARDHQAAQGEPTGNNYEGRAGIGEKTCHQFFDRARFIAYIQRVAGSLTHFLLAV